MSPEPNLYVVAAPSGGGKTSLVNALLQRDPRIRLSVSHTTRPPRPGEVDGVHYHFVDETTFSKLVEEGAFLEYARVYGHFYGTGRDSVTGHLAAGYDVMLDIDWQGARQVRLSFPRCCSIFILPPSLEELQKRLSRRGQDGADVIARRMQQARSEMAHCREFDFIVINDDFAAALEDIHSIVRRRTPVRPGQEGRITALLAELL
ncbi:MAG: guanylate kinase [Proteobacteria bacterium]|nr:guanylate kinase [Pseudomonadota bacterium]